MCRETSECITVSARIDIRFRQMVIIRITAAFSVCFNVYDLCSVSIRLSARKGARRTYCAIFTGWLLSNRAGLCAMQIANAAESDVDPSVTVRSVAPRGPLTTSR